MLSASTQYLLSLLIQRQYKPLLLIPSPSFFTVVWEHDKIITGAYLGGVKRAHENEPASAVFSCHGDDRLNTCI